MNKAEEYRRRAEECERDAAKLSLASDRAKMADIAKRFREMADDADAARKRE